MTWHYLDIFFCSLLLLWWAANWYWRNNVNVSAHDTRSLNVTCLQAPALLLRAPRDQSPGEVSRADRPSAPHWVPGVSQGQPQVPTVVRDHITWSRVSKCTDTWSHVPSCVFLQSPKVHDFKYLKNITAISLNIYKWQEGESGDPGAELPRDVLHRPGGDARDGSDLQGPRGH